MVAPKKSHQYRLMVETRRLYRFENQFSRKLPYECRRDRPITELRLIAQTVWRKWGRKGAKCPEIKCHHGYRMTGGWYSYALGYSEIYLSRSQRNVMVLLHELTHTMGHGTHGKGFVEKYIRLLVEYGWCDEGELRMGLALYNIK